MKRKRNKLKNKITCIVAGLALFAASCMEPGLTVAAANAGIHSVKEKYAIESDVILNGNGSGCHAKLVFLTSVSAFSFGIQYDEHAIKPYNGKAVLMVENVQNNSPGGQTYDWPKGVVVEKGKPCHLMLTLTKNGDLRTYYNGEVIGTYHNDGLSEKMVAPGFAVRVEGAGRKNGDTIDARFENLSVKRGKTVNGSVTEYPGLYDLNKTIKSSYDPKARSAHIMGSISGLGKKDWDSAPASVSGCVQFQF